jgi:hypothetical protein
MTPAEIHHGITEKLVIIDSTRRQFIHPSSHGAVAAAPSTTPCTASFVVLFIFLIPQGETLNISQSKWEVAFQPANSSVT